MEVALLGRVVGLDGMHSLVWTEAVQRGCVCARALAEALFDMLACMRIWEELGAGGMIWSLWRTHWCSFCGVVSRGKVIRYECKGCGERKSEGVGGCRVQCGSSNVMAEYWHLIGCCVGFCRATTKGF